jgi:eukaryotic-like serine/threonine-protein kinase
MFRTKTLSHEIMDFLKKLFDKHPKVEKVDIERRFELLARVGQGSMSKVWRARDLMNGRMLAVKVLDKAKTSRFEARFMGLHKPSEGEVAGSLKHPNIVRTYEFGTTTDNEQYLVMDFVEGLSLSYLVDVQNDKMKEHRLTYIIQLGEAIDYLHRQNWIHRDLCPRNVMIDTDNTVKLIDFGLTVPNTPAFQKPGNRTGTVNYMAPELIKRQRTDQRIDVFSFAVTCYEMYTKRLPWNVPAQETMETVLQHINKAPTPVQELAPDIHPVVAETIMKGMRPDPNDRFQTVAEMLVPLRKTHAEIEAQRKAERQTKAAAKKGAPAMPDSKLTKPDADGDFFSELLLDEGRTRAKPAPAKSQERIADQPPTKRPKTTQPAAAAKATGKQADKGLSAPPPQKPNVKATVPPADDSADEFEGIEVDESPHEFDGIKLEKPGTGDDDEPILRLSDD